jgi:hypothetical protein
VTDEPAMADVPAVVEPASQPGMHAWAMRGRGIEVHVTNLHAPALAFARSVGVLDVDHVCPTIERAVKHVEIHGRHLSRRRPRSLR